MLTPPLYDKVLCWYCRGDWKLPWNQEEYLASAISRGKQIQKVVTLDRKNLLKIAYHAWKLSPPHHPYGAMLYFDGCGGRSSAIYVSKNKSPLLIGLGDGCNMVLWCHGHMIRETNQYMEIHDQELVIVKADSALKCKIWWSVKNRLAIQQTRRWYWKGTAHTSKSMSNQLSCAKLIQAYTDESGQVVVDQLLSRLFKKQTASLSLRLCHPPLDLL